MLSNHVTLSKYLTCVCSYLHTFASCVAGDTPLMVAVESEQTAAVRMLIKEGGADVNRASETTGE